MGKSSSCSRARTACRLPAKAFAATVAHTGPTYYKLQLYVSLNIARIANAVVKVLKVVEVGLAWKALNPVQSVRNGRDYGVSQQGRYKAARAAKNYVALFPSVNPNFLREFIAVQ